MRTTESTTADNRSGSGGTDLACAACSHAEDAHDPIGLRYCSATLEGNLDRGCVCDPAKKIAHQNRNYQ